MFRTTLVAGIFAAFAVAAGGCEIYFGPDDCDGNYCDDYYEYCDETGCYWCDAWGCYPDVPPCGDGCWCDDHYDCSPGWYCGDDNNCHDAGFCSVDWECPDGFVCDDRSTCVPEGTEAACDNNADCAMGTYCEDGTCVDSGICCGHEDCPPNFECDDRGTCVPVSCTGDDQCLEGSICDVETGTCTETGTCEPDGTCPEGYECDAERNTCTPCVNGVCGCTSNDDCDAGMFCDVDNGVCYVPACSEIEDETTCDLRYDCIPVYTGHNCTDPEGNACESGDSNCTCESFTFAACSSVND